MDTFELRREQLKLAPKIMLSDSFTEIKTMGGAVCQQLGNKLLACVVVCEFPSFKIKEQKTYVLDHPLPYRPDFSAYREMPAIIEAFNQLDEEPDILLVKGSGILHPRKIGLASHLGLALNVPTIGVQDKVTFGNLQEEKISVDGEVLGFEIKTREHSNPIYVSPGHHISFETVQDIIPKTIVHPHKLPEPLHLAHKFGRKMARGKNDE